MRLIVFGVLDGTLAHGSGFGLDGLGGLGGSCWPMGLVLEFSEMGASVDDS